MTHATLSIRHWGNNLGVRLPQAIARAAHLQADQQVSMLVDESGRIIIEPVVQQRLSLNDRLQRFDPARHGGEAMAAPAVGAEKW